MRRTITTAVLHAVAISLTFVAGAEWQRNGASWWTLALIAAVFLLDLIAIHVGHLYGYAKGIDAERHAATRRRSMR